MSAALASLTQEHNEEGHAWPAGEKKRRLKFEAFLLQESFFYVVLQAEVNKYKTVCIPQS